MYWSLETTWPRLVVWPTCWVPNWAVLANAVPVAARPTAVTHAVTSVARRPNRLPRRTKSSFSARRLRVTCMGYPFGEVESSSTLPSNCHSGLGESPVGVRTRK